MLMMRMTVLMFSLWPAGQGMTMRIRFTILRLLMTVFILEASRIQDVPASCVAGALIGEGNPE